MKATIKFVDEMFVNNAPISAIKVDEASKVFKPYYTEYLSLLSCQHWLPRNGSKWKQFLAPISNIAINKSMNDVTTLV